MDPCLKEIFHSLYWQTSYEGSRKEVLGQYEDYNGALSLLVKTIAFMLSLGILLF